MVLRYCSIFVLDNASSNIIIPAIGAAEKILILFCKGKLHICSYYLVLLCHYVPIITSRIYRGEKLANQERSELAAAISLYFSKLKTVSVTGTSGFNNKINFVEMFAFKQSNSNDKW